MTSSSIGDVIDCHLKEDQAPPVGGLVRHLKNALDVGRRRWLAAECWLALDPASRAALAEIDTASTRFAARSERSDHDGGADGA